MKAKLLPYVIKYGPLVNLIGVLFLLVLVTVNTHWSVAALLAWMAYTISSFASGINKMKHDYNKKIKAVRQEHQHTVKQFDQFIKTVNRQAKDLKGQVIGRAVKKPKPNPTRPRCEECMRDPKPGAVIYNHNNCPIHD